jgi:phosphoenolpyruvate carboxykinase (ATP)
VLNQRMQASGASAYLVNTGWNGTGQRISIRDTRAIIDAILSGELDSHETTLIPHFNLAIPGELSNVDDNILDPRNTYQNGSQWDAKATKLALMFVENFAQFTDTEAGKALVHAGPEI